MMKKEAPPGGLTPQSEHADGGGVRRNRCIGKPLETMGLQSYGAKADDLLEEAEATLAGLQLRKPWETMGQQSYGG